MQSGNVMLSTPRRDLTPADLGTPAVFRDVTATIWNATTGIWHQHFAAVLDAESVEAILQHTGQPCLPIV